MRTFGIMHFISVQRFILRGPGFGCIDFVMGRKRKSLEDWTVQYKDLEIVQKGNGKDELVCCFCDSVLPSDLPKKPYDVIREHLASARHGMPKRKVDGEHTLFDVCYHRLDREKSTERAIQELVFMIVKSSISCKHAGGPLG